MFSFVLSIVEGIFSFFMGRQVSLGEKAGRAEQAVKDDEKTITQLEAEKDAAAQRDSAIDELRDHKF